MDGFSKCTVTVGDCLTDEVDINKDLYDITYSDAAASSHSARDGSSSRVSASMIASMLRDEPVPWSTPPAPPRAPPAYELEREQAEELAALEDM